MIITIIAILLMTIAQILIGMIWYSKVLFGNAFIKLENIDMSAMDKNKMHLAYIKQITASIVKALAIYFIVAQIFFLLPATFFGIAMAITALFVINDFENGIWRNQSFKLFLIHAGHSIVNLTVCFIIALIFINL